MFGCLSAPDHYVPGWQCGIPVVTFHLNLLPFLCNTPIRIIVCTYSIAPGIRPDGTGQVSCINDLHVQHGPIQHNRISTILKCQPFRCTRMCTLSITLVHPSCKRTPYPCGCTLLQHDGGPRRDGSTSRLSGRPATRLGYPRATHVYLCAWTHKYRERSADITTREREGNPTGFHRTDHAVICAIDAPLHECHMCSMYGIQYIPLSDIPPSARPYVLQWYVLYNDPYV